MSSDPFYKSHWKEIDEERMAAYRTMFKWSDGAEQLYAPTEIRRGQRVADFGCGPGYTAVEFARRVGPEGHVHALDINLTLLRRYDDALVWAKKAQQWPSAPVWAYFSEVVPLAHLGRVEEAREALERAFTVKPDLSAGCFKQIFHFKNPAEMAHVMDGLHKAGLPR